MTRPPKITNQSTFSFRKLCYHLPVRHPRIRDRQHYLHGEAGEAQLGQELLRGHGRGRRDGGQLPKKKRQRSRINVQFCLRQLDFQFCTFSIENQKMNGAGRDSRNWPHRVLKDSQCIFCLQSQISNRRKTLFFFFYLCNFCQRLNGLHPLQFSPEGGVWCWMAGF